MEITEILEIAAQVVGILAIVASFTPTPIDNVVLVALKKALDFGAFNVGKAKNAK
jgi:hypothetical protein